eukprot:COSAG01_NODE_398_length_17547_cov_206.793501_9_plen_230_part_00
MIVRKQKILRYKDGKKDWQQIALCQEKVIELKLNDASIKLHSTGRLEKPYIVGYLLSQELIDSHDCLDQLNQEKVGIWHYCFDCKKKTSQFRKKNKAWGKGEILAKLADYISEYQDEASAIKKLGFGQTAAIIDGQAHQTFFATGLTTDEALQKVLGQAFLAKQDLNNHALIIACQLDQSSLSKYHNLGFQTVITRGGASQGALDYADQHNLTLIAFARPNRFSILNIA